MALVKPHSFKGFVADAAYHEVVALHSDKHGLFTHVTARIWKDSTKEQLLDTERLAFDYDPDMTVKKAYTAMKQLIEFSGATDV